MIDEDADGCCDVTCSLPATCNNLQPVACLLPATTCNLHPPQGELSSRFLLLRTAKNVKIGPSSIHSALFERDN
jgi:hypothetical protein